jgi:GMP synthase-like glutamine amidotransferase
MIGILEAGGPPAELIGHHESYVTMFRRSLGAGVVARTFDVVNAPLPEPAQCDGWLITGSEASAYDDTRWVNTLCQFLRDIPKSTPIVGVCFGHQLMARAYGGERPDRKPGRSIFCAGHIKGVRLCPAGAPRS